MLSKAHLNEYNIANQLCYSKKLNKKKKREIGEL